MFFEFLKSKFEVDKPILTFLNGIQQNLFVHLLKSNLYVLSFAVFIKATHWTFKNKRNSFTQDLQGMGFIFGSFIWPEK